MRECVIYSRVSSDSQSYQSQINDLLRYSKENNYKVIKTFSEKVSGYKDKKREEYDNMKEYVLSHNIKYILIWELSRLSRNTLKSLQEIKFFTEKGINIYFKKENINSLNGDMSTKLLLSIMSTIAENESETIKGRVGKGLRDSAEKGKRTGLMTIPYGYKSDENSMLVIDEDEAKVIELIFDLANKETPQRSIAQHLNSLNIQTRWSKLGRININRVGVEVPIKWKPNAIGIILRNPIYKGERKYRNEIFKSPKIIDEELWNVVQTKTIKKVGYVLKETKYEYLLKGKIQCGKCGRLYGARTETRYGKNESYYTCNGAKDLEIKCKNGQFSSKILDEGVFDLMVSHKDFWMKMKEDILKKFDIDEKETQVNYYKKEISNLDRKFERVLELFKDGYYDKKKLQEETDRIKMSKKESEFQMQKIDKEIANFHKMKESTNVDEVLGDWFGDDSFNNRRSFIDKFLNKVIIYKVDKSSVDVKRTRFSEIKTGGLIQKNPITDKDKILYMEIFAYDNPNPLKCYITNFTKATAILS